MKRFLFVIGLVVLLAAVNETACAQEVDWSKVSDKILSKANDYSFLKLDFLKLRKVHQQEIPVCGGNFYFSCYDNPGVGLAVDVEVYENRSHFPYYFKAIIIYREDKDEYRLFIYTRPYDEGWREVQAIQFPLEGSPPVGVKKDDDVSPGCFRIYLNYRDQEIAKK